MGLDGLRFCFYGTHWSAHRTGTAPPATFRVMVRKGTLLRPYQCVQIVSQGEHGHVVALSYLLRFVP